MKKILFYTLAGIFLGATIVGVKNAQGSEYERGEKLYKEKCQICHGKKGDGDGPAAISFSPRPADFINSKFWQDDVEKKIANTIRNGHGMMPAFDLTADQIKAIIDYMEQTFKK